MNESGPLVSVVIPTYNQAALLKEALESVLVQTFSNWEAVVVNNFSDDDTVEVVQSIKDDRIKLISFGNNGVIGAARNVGVHNSSGSLIAFLDSDDWWQPEKLETVVTLFEQPDTDLVCHDEYLVTDDGKTQVLTYGPYTTYSDMLFRCNCLSTSATVIRRSKFMEVGGFSEDPHFVGVEDYDLWLRLAKEGCGFVYRHKVLGTYRVHSQCFTSQIERHCRNILNLLNSHFAQWDKQTPYFRFLIRRRRARTLGGAAHSFLRQGAHRDARRLLSMALREDPLAWRAWLLGIASLARVRI